MFFNKNILKITRILNNISPPILIHLAVEDNLVNDSDFFGLELIQTMITPTRIIL